MSSPWRHEDAAKIFTTYTQRKLEYQYKTAEWEVLPGAAYLQNITLQYIKKQYIEPSQADVLKKGDCPTTFRAAGEPSTAPKPAPTATPEATIMHDIKSSELVKKKDTLECDTCRIACDFQRMLDVHLDGAKH